MRKLSLIVIMALSGLSAFAYDALVDGIYYNISGDEAEVTSPNYPYPSAYSGDVVIPESLDLDKTYRVTGIGKLAFYNCSGLTSVSIPESVTSIDDYAFSGCSGLTSITIPGNVTSIGQYAFFGCSGLTSISIPESVTNIGDAAFNGTAWYDSQPDGMVYVGDFVYRYKGTLSENTVAIKEGTLRIADGAFSYLRGLTSVVIPESITSIGEEAFAECNCLTSIVIPRGVTSISEEAFRGCYFVTSNFSNNSSLQDNACWGACLCDEETIDGLLMKDDAVVRCRPWATSVVIPDGVTSISTRAFDGCSGVTSVIISASVTILGYHAFWDCTSLTDVYCYAVKVPSIDPNILVWSTDDYILRESLKFFNESYISSATLHVPAASVEEYKATYPWENFGAIVPLTDADAIEDVKAKETPEHVCYDILGRRFTKPQKGLNTIDGRKVLIK